MAKEKNRRNRRIKYTEKKREMDQCNKLGGFLNPFAIIY